MLLFLTIVAAMNLSVAVVRYRVQRKDPPYSSFILRLAPPCRIKFQPWQMQSVLALLLSYYRLPYRGTSCKLTCYCPGYLTYVNLLLCSNFSRIWLVLLDLPLPDHLMMAACGPRVIPTILSCTIILILRTFFLPTQWAIWRYFGDLFILAFHLVHAPLISMATQVKPHAVGRGHTCVVQFWKQTRVNKLDYGSLESKLIIRDNPKPPSPQTHHYEVSVN